MEKSFAKHCYLLSIFKNNYVSSKSSAQGGAISVNNHASRIENCLFYGNTITSAVGNTNSDSSRGGAIYINNPNYWDSNVNQYQSLDSYIINNTIVNNHVKTNVSGSYLTGAALYVEGWDPFNVYVFNNIIWNNNVGWITFLHTSENAGLDRTIINLYQGFEFIFSQTLMLGPFLFVIFIFILKKITFSFQTKFLFNM